MKRIFAGRMVLFFCCLAGLAWASWGLFNSSPGVAISNDALMANIKVGSWGLHRCNTSNLCPAPCMPPVAYFAYNFETQLWELQVIYAGQSGCSLDAIGKSYKTCGFFFLCTWCPTDKDKCGSAQSPIGVGTMLPSGPEFTGFCDGDDAPCAKGCG